MVGRLADVVVLNDDERRFLEIQIRRHRAPRSLSDRCRMILLCADGLESKEVARRMNVHEHTVGKWRRRFVHDRIEGLTDEYRPGRPRTVSDDQVAEVIERTLHSKMPPTGRSDLWQLRRACHIPQSGASGGRSGCNRTEARPSSCQPIHSSQTRFRILLACICRPQTGQLYFVWMKNRRYRRWTVSSRFCR